MNNWHSFYMDTQIKRLEKAIGIWIKNLDDVEGWREWHRRKLHATLDVDDPWPLEEKVILGDFPLPEPINREHAVVMSYYNLVTSLSSLRDCEYYFRRYPFRGLPVPHHDHLRYVCEMYFGRFYEFSERMKVVSRAVKELLPETNVPFSDPIKNFGKHFKPELKERNLGNHHYRFEDIRIDNIAIISMVASSNAERQDLKRRMRNSYRQATHVWAERVRRRSMQVEEYLETVASLILDHCAFLSDLVPLASKEGSTPP